MARIAWTFVDPVASTTEYMSINPNAGASPAYQKNLAKSVTTAPGGEAQVLISEGADSIVQFDFSGVILTQAQYEFLLTAFQKRHPVELTDDLGRTFTIYLESFTPERQLSRTYPWKHTYQASSVVISGE